MKYYLTLVTLFIFSLAVFTQVPTPTPPKVLVDQSYIDDATAAFVEVKALRDLVQKYKETEGRSLVERNAADAMIKGLDQLLLIKDRTIDQYVKLTAGLQQIIDFQFQIITKMQAMLTKPTTFWQKVLNGVKELAKAAAYILLGAGIGGIGSYPVLFEELPYPFQKKLDWQRLQHMAIGGGLASTAFWFR